MKSLKQFPLLLILPALLACGKKASEKDDLQKGENKEEVKNPEPIGKASVILSADGPGDTYELINSVLGGTGNVIEAPDVDNTHTNFGKHITEVYDDDLKTHVFAFHIHLAHDNDKGKDSDRQRNEIKTYDRSPDNVKASLNEKVTYKWKFKLDAGFKPSGDFTHIHQIKPIDGNATLPIITLTPRYKSSGEIMEVIHTGDTDNSSKKYLASIPLSDFKGHWVEVEETITYATAGKYEISIKRLSDNKVLLNKSDANIDMWRSGTTTCRPKWGIYRRILQPQMLRDETVLFNDFNITEY